MSARKQEDYVKQHYKYRRRIDLLYLGLHPGYRLRNRITNGVIVGLEMVRKIATPVTQGETPEKPGKGMGKIPMTLDPMYVPDEYARKIVEAQSEEYGCATPLLWRLIGIFGVGCALVFFTLVMVYFLTHGL